MMPLDPTRENLAWFQGLGARALQVGEAGQSEQADLGGQSNTQVATWLADDRFARHWLGLLACEAMAAEFPEVADYYLHGGRARVESAVAQVASLLHGERALGDPRGPALQPVDLTDHLLTLQSALDQDPHYRYGVSLDPHRLAITPELGLVAATQQSAPDGSTLTFRIFERFAEAVNMRPIPIQLNVRVPADSSDAEALRLFARYGKPMKVPASFSADLPGGLGGDFPAAIVAMGPTEDAKSGRLRFRLLDPDGAELATLAVSAGPTSTSADGQGAYRRAQDATGDLQLELLTRLDDLTCT